MTDNHRLTAAVWRPAFFTLAALLLLALLRPLTARADDNSLGGGEWIPSLRFDTGETQNRPQGFARGDLLVPVEGHFYGSIGALLGSVDGSRIEEVNGSLYYRRKELGALGLTGQWSDINNETSRGVPVTTYTRRYGGEAEYYLPRFTLFVRGGEVSSKTRSGTYGNAGLEWFATDDLMLWGAGAVNYSQRYGRAGINYRPGFSFFSNLSLFAQGTFGDGLNSILVGVNLFFGPANTRLIDQQRSDTASGLLD
jgi:hypothetical protein